MTEQVKVGLVVLVAVGILLATVFYMLNLGVGGQYVEYRTYLKFAGGLEPGAPVRFGGLKVGRVKALRVAPQDPSLIEISLSVRRGVPVRSDSLAAVSQLGLLGENYIEIQPGRSSARITPGGTVPSAETQDLNALLRRMNAVMEQVEPLVIDLRKNLNKVSAGLDTVTANVGDLTGDENRAHLAGVLRQTDEMLAANRPRVDSLTADLQSASAKLEPLFSDLRNTTAKVDKLTADLNGVVAENRKEFQASIAQLSKTLDTTHQLVLQLNSLAATNSGNLDAILENLRATSDSLKEFSETVAQHPFLLLRGGPRADRQVPGATKTKATKPAAATGRSGR
jgi:phospholipid/cholesterol/gamma-HCH transport system substrate-binding protein